MADHIEDHEAKACAHNGFGEEVRGVRVVHTTEYGSDPDEHTWDSLDDKETSPADLTLHYKTGGSGLADYWAVGMHVVTDRHYVVHKLPYDLHAGDDSKICTVELLPDGVRIQTPSGLSDLAKWVVNVE